MKLVCLTKGCWIEQVSETTTGVEPLQLSLELRLMQAAFLDFFQHSYDGDTEVMEVHFISGDDSLFLSWRALVPILLLTLLREKLRIGNKMAAVQLIQLAHIGRDLIHRVPSVAEQELLRASQLGAVAEKVPTERLLIFRERLGGVGSYHRKPEYLLSEVGVLRH